MEQAQAGPPVVAASAAEVEPEHAMDQQCQPSLPTAQSSGPYLLAFAWTFGAEALEAHPQCGICYGVTRYRSADGGVVHEPLKRTGESIDSLLPSMLGGRWWGTSTPLYRRALLQRASVDLGHVLFAGGHPNVVQAVRDGKVTSEPEKGYYFFWIEKGGEKYYVQTPIARTYIEEMP